MLTSGFVSNVKLKLVRKSKYDSRINRRVGQNLRSVESQWCCEIQLAEGEAREVRLERV